MSVEVEVSSPEEIAARLRRFAEIFPDGVGTALYLVANDPIMNEAKADAPVDSGYMRSTGYVNEPVLEKGSIDVELGFYANYSAPVHDRTDLHHTTGTDHFLSKSLERNASTVKQRILEQIESAFGGA